MTSRKDPWAFISEGPDGVQVSLHVTRRLARLAAQAFVDDWWREPMGKKPKDVEAALTRICEKTDLYGRIERLRVLDEAATRAMLTPQGASA